MEGLSSFANKDFLCACSVPPWRGAGLGEISERAVDHAQHSSPEIRIAKTLPILSESSGVGTYPTPIADQGQKLDLGAARLGPIIDQQQTATYLLPPSTTAQSSAFASTWPPRHQSCTFCALDTRVLHFAQSSPFRPGSPSFEIVPSYTSRTTPVFANVILSVVFATYTLTTGSADIHYVSLMGIFGAVVLS